MNIVNKIRAVGYVRVSSEDQVKEGISLEYQKAKITAYCDLKDLDLITVLEDPGISARNLKRPGVQVVLDMVMKKSVDAVADSGEASLSAIQKQLRHKRATTTDNYIKAIDPKLKQTAEVIGGIWKAAKGEVRSTIGSTI